jgi:mono/diheme cytochrome c family protein
LIFEFPNCGAVIVRISPQPDWLIRRNIALVAMERLPMILRFYRIPQMLLFAVTALSICNPQRLISAEEQALPVGLPEADPAHAAKMIEGLALFNQTIKPVLVDRCVHCHSGQELSGGLDLASRDGLLKGGESGPAAIVGRGDRSLVYKLTSHTQEPFMPEEGEKLTDSELASLAKWIDLGAPYEKSLVESAPATETLWTEKKVSDKSREHWAFQPLLTALPPAAVSAWATSPIDRFVEAKLAEQGLVPNSQASRLQLVRRLYFAIIGLPPTPQEVTRFVNDPRPDAVAHLVDELLASNHFGERWARRWLDLARFAESHGFEHDYDRQSAYQYRDFVIQAFNEGLPFDKFIEWQIAGDELEPSDRRALMATGFLAAGVHSTQITKNEVEKHRYDEMDDMLATTSTTFLGLTVGCARCHDHKYDAIPQADYYRMLSTFTSAIRSETIIDFDPTGYALAKEKFDAAHAPLEQAVIDDEANHLMSRFTAWQQTSDRDMIVSEWLAPSDVQWRGDGGEVFTPQADASHLVSGNNPVIGSFHATFTVKSSGIRAIRIEALADSSLPQNGPGRAGNGNFALSDVVVSIAPDMDETRLSLPALADQPSNFEEPGPTLDQLQPQTIKLVSAAATFEQAGLSVAHAIDADSISAWAVDPQLGQSHAIVLTPETPFGYKAGSKVTVTLKFHNNAQHQIGRPRISFSTKSEPPCVVGGAGDEDLLHLVAAPYQSLTPANQDRVLNWYKRTQDTRWQQLEAARNQHLATAPKPRLEKVLITSEGVPPLVLHTQAEREFLEVTHFLKRGDVNNKEGIAEPGFLQALTPNLTTPYPWVQPHPEGSPLSYRRAAFAKWLTHRDGAANLVARVAVNRLWAQVFGRGLVATPSDFGVRGERPSHPELLDYLAGELLRRNWDWKPILREMFISSTYQQSSHSDDPAKASIDPLNVYLWHYPSRRLEAEVIRDSILASSDLLDRRMFGPGTLDENHRRRSLYFTVKRSQLVSMMTVFDAPDALQSTPERPSTTVAPQALLLMNNPLIRTASQSLAQRSLTDSQSALPQAIELAYLATVSRPPTPDEQAAGLAFIGRQQSQYSGEGATLSAMTDFCQVLFCLNEFIYCD